MMKICVILVLFSKVYITQTDIASQPVPLMMVRLGEKVLFSCLYSDKVEYISWFKQTVGAKPRLIAVSHKYTHPIYYGNFSQTRFKVLENGTANQLTISNTEFSDSAIYYCGGMNNYAMTFATGTFLIVKGSKKQQSNSRTVVQQPVSDLVHPGDSVALNCTVEGETCAGEHSVYWFRHGSGGSLPGLIYTHGNRSDECDKSPEAGSPTHSCVYSLTKRNLSPSDAGIYYCAVITCGNILFGNGTQLNFNGPTMDPVLLGLGAALVFCVVFIIFLVCYICKNTGDKPAHASQPVHPDCSIRNESMDQYGSAEILNYAALQFADKKCRSGQKKRESKEESTYSQVRYTARD